MTKWILYSTIIASLWVASPTFAATYKCKEVDSIARLGLADGVPVSIESGDDDEDTDGDYCAFSVNGVAASSPPINVVRKALNYLRNSNATWMRSSSDFSRERDRIVNAIAYSLIAASNLDSPSNELKKYLQNNSKAIAECFRAYASQNPMGDRSEVFENHGTNHNGFCYFSLDVPYGIRLDGSPPLEFDKGQMEHAQFVIIRRSSNTSGHLAIGVGTTNVRRLYIQPKGF